MKKQWIWVLLPLLLSGCAAEETFETICDEPAAQVMAEPREVAVQLPEEAEIPVLESDGQQIYLCEDYEIILENRPSGDLKKTVRHISGYDPDRLTILKTSQGTQTRYEFVWVCAGEAGERLGRAVILDDGQYHYCMTVLRDAGDGEAAAVSWDGVFSSFTLV